MRWLAQQTIIPAPIPDLLIAETALRHNLGVVHVDRDFERIAEIRPLVVPRLR